MSLKLLRQFETTHAYKKERKHVKAFNIYSLHLIVACCVYQKNHALLLASFCCFNKTGFTFFNHEAHVWRKTSIPMMVAPWVFTRMLVIAIGVPAGRQRLEQGGAVTPRNTRRGRRQSAVVPTRRTRVLDSKRGWKVVFDRWWFGVCRTSYLFWCFIKWPHPR